MPDPEVGDPDNKYRRTVARALGILAGGGTLPGQIAAAAAAAGRRVFMIGLAGFADPAVLAPWPHEVIRITAAGQILAALRAFGCQDIVMIGPVRRPSLLDLRPDAEGARILARIGRAAFAGDDGLLGAVVRVFAEEGFRVVGAQEILRAALGPAGLLSRAAPDALAMADVRRGMDVARTLGAADVGQACVVQHGIVLAVEAAEGTDAMLSRCTALARPGHRRGPGQTAQAGAGTPRRPSHNRAGHHPGRRRRRIAGDCIRGWRHHPGRP